MGEFLWKVAERRIARLFGTERVGPRGQNTPDAISDSYAIEVKHQKHIANWLKEALEQAEHNGGKWAPEKLPIVVLHEKGQEYTQCLVMVRLEQFIEWFGE